MTNEVRNLKGEIIQSSHDGEHWYQLSSSTWLFLGGLLLFNGGCFVNPGLLDTLFILLDVRLWPWWYFLCLTLLIVFSVKWFFIYRNWEDYDDMEINAAKRFHRMAVTVTIVMGVLVLLNATHLYGFFYHPLSRWLGYGDFSWMALLSFLLVFAMIVPVVYFFKEQRGTLHRTCLIVTAFHSASIVIPFRLFRQYSLLFCRLIPATNGRQRSTLDRTCLRLRGRLQ
ncbi:MAG: hypothetical protein LBQ54_10195 [Planctomycetaceae bacterium]|jgi:magnesium-transporting ATPase (P-type)|nr:hypothetical protein [Planctomycetaceae bacterium]